MPEQEVIFLYGTLIRILKSNQKLFRPIRLTLARKIFWGAKICVRANCHLQFLITLLKIPNND